MPDFFKGDSKGINAQFHLNDVVEDVNARLRLEKMLERVYAPIF